MAGVHLFIFPSPGIDLPFNKLIIMRKLIYLPIVLFGVIILNQSCSKQAHNEMIKAPTTKVINAKIAANGAYQLSLDNMGTVSINNQASHFKLSQIETDGKTGALIYKYNPAADYTGTDEVMLSATSTYFSSASGCHNDHSSANASSVTSYITVKINVGN